LWHFHFIEKHKVISGQQYFKVCWPKYFAPTGAKCGGTYPQILPEEHLGAAFSAVNNATRIL
jgi:hypothetical protein